MLLPRSLRRQMSARQQATYGVYAHICNSLSRARPQWGGWGLLAGAGMGMFESGLGAGGSFARGCRGALGRVRASSLEITTKRWRLGRWSGDGMPLRGAP